MVRLRQAMIQRYTIAGRTNVAHLAGVEHQYSCSTVGLHVVDYVAEFDKRVVLMF